MKNSTMSIFDEKFAEVCPPPGVAVIEDAADLELAPSPASLVKRPGVKQIAKLRVYAQACSLGCAI